MCVEHVHNQATMDEEFKVLFEYVDHEHQLLGKIVMGLKNNLEGEKGSKSWWICKQENARLGS